MEEFKLELIKSINNLPGVKLLKEDFGSLDIKLFGGSIITAMDNIGGKFSLLNSVTAKPKDYDLISGIETIKLVEKGYEFICETDNARTFTKKGMDFQFIKSNINRVDFTISQISFSLQSNSISGDLFVLKNRILIPSPQEDLHLRFNQLSRITHYQAKGFTIHPSTFNGLVETTYKLAGGTRLKFKQES